jgi:hypothetical protein
MTKPTIDDIDYKLKNLLNHKDVTSELEDYLLDVLADFRHLTEEHWEAKNPDETTRGLWEVMSLASSKLLDETMGEATTLQCWAAEIEALADAVVPKTISNPYADAEDLYAEHARQKVRKVLLEQAKDAKKNSLKAMNKKHRCQGQC